VQENVGVNDYLVKVKLDPPSPPYCSSVFRTDVSRCGPSAVVWGGGVS